MVVSVDGSIVFSGFPTTDTSQPLVSPVRNGRLTNGDHCAHALRPSVQVLPPTNSQRINTLMQVDKFSWLCCDITIIIAGNKLKVARLLGM